MTEYIKGIIFFLIFVSFVGIILPEGKYKSYINVVLGFVTMFLVFRPVADLSGIIGDMSLRLSEVSDGYLTEDHEKDYQTLIADAFGSRMREQVNQIADALGYSLTELDAGLDLGTGELKSISVTLTAANSNTNTDTGDGASVTSPDISVPLITVPPVGSAGGAQGGVPNGAPETASAANAADIKKILSDFYQLPPEHIHVTIQ